MPTVYSVMGYTIFFWSNENDEPIHVHVCKGTPKENATKIWIEEQPRLEHNKSRVPRKVLNKIMKWLAVNRALIIEAWHDHFNQ